MLPRTGCASAEGGSFITSRPSFHQRERVLVLVRVREQVEGRAREQEKNLALGQVRLSRQLQELV